MNDEMPLRPGSALERQRSGRGLRFLALLLAFALGGGTAGFLAWHGDLASWLPRRGVPGTTVTPVAAEPPRTTGAVSALETRLALLEDRFSRLNQEANAAAGQAGRAEALLVAVAARRAVERGQPLGYLADALRLRFAGAQPDAVATVIAFAQRPVTRDQLDARLDALAPQLGEAPADTSDWTRWRREVANFFTVRRESTAMVRPEARVAGIKLMLANGNVVGAADAAARLPGAPAGADWIADARRYGAAQQALDVIEAAALVGGRTVPATAGEQGAAPAR